MNRIKNPRNLIERFLSQSEKGMLLVDDKDYIVWVNEATCTILEHTEAELLSLRAHELGLIINLSNLIDFTRRNGEIITLSTTAEYRSIDKMDYTLITFEEIFVGEISELQKSEQQKIKNLSMKQSTSVNVWLLDSDYNYTFFTDVHKELMNQTWGADIAIGDNLLSFITNKEYMLKVHEAYESILEGTPHHSIDRLTLPSGEEMYIENFGHPLRSKDNDVTGIMYYSVDITKRTELENKLKLSVSLLESIMNSPENIHILSLDYNYNYLFFNNAHQESMHKVWQKRPEIGINVLELLDDPEYRKKAKNFYDRSLAGEIINETSELRDTDDNILYFDNISSPIVNADGKIQGITVFILDTTEKELARKEIIKSLQEKEFLLKEIHHRIKNNLQMITSMLNLQMTMVDDKTVHRILEDSLNRISTMGMIHKTLYQGDDLSEIDMEQYCSLLIKSITDFYNLSEPKIEIKTRFEQIRLPVDHAIPTGLIINELITNSMKYAFTGLKRGEIIISMKQFAEGAFHLQVKDNGRGLPAETDIESSASLGINLVSAFVKQLHGEIEFISDKGLTVNIRFTA